ncbi:MAG TPA: amino acid adenylation domain-containing protein [Longimicrobium sp.]|nr:amino acid adenylation domain-containing protein [Longimicrobium sp.]
MTSIHPFAEPHHIPRNAGAEPDPSTLPVAGATDAELRRAASLDEHARYWMETLAGAPELLQLPTDHARPARQDSAAAAVGLALDAALTAGLKALADRHGTTPRATLLAGWAAVLARLSGQDDVVVGATAGIGASAGILPVRVDLSGAPTVAEVLGRVTARADDAERHATLSFARVAALLQPARSAAHAPLAQATFAWDASADGLALPGSADGTRDAATVDLALRLREDDGRIAGTLTYATSLFTAATAERYAGYLRRVLEAMAADAAQRVDGIEILPPAERARIVDEWNATDTEFPAGLCIHQLFEAHAARAPGAPAVAYGDVSLTYGEVDERANRLASHLRRHGVGPEVRVGICLERAPELVVAILAVLKAGGAYVPLDPAYPAARLAFMLADSAVAVLLTQESLRGLLPSVAAVPVVSVDGARAEIAAERAEPAASAVEPRNLAYVIYTSGSTGTPKGIALAHRGVLNNLVDLNRGWRVGADDRVLLLSSLSFDMSVYETLGILAAGGAVVIPGETELRDPARWAALMRRHAVTVWNSAPALLGMLVDHLEGCPGDAPPALRLAFLGGDWVPVSLPERLRARVPAMDVVVMGGATEASIHSIIFPVRETDPRWTSIPYGVPMANQRAYVLDARLRPVPVGVAGELYLAGVGLARGYTGRPGLTAERFLPDAEGRGGERMYRTGDRARWVADGNIELLGRLDVQVKIRGLRIELGEIEAVLRQHPGVERCVAMAREDRAGEKRLVAYVVGQPDVDAVRDHLRRNLPEYMVPGAIVVLDALPLSPNGKVDRKALPVPDTSSADAPYVAPSTPTEAVLAGIWAEVLGVERVGAGDGFFDLGGHSLLAVQVLSRVRQALGVDVVLGDLFRQPVLADFAAWLDGAARAALPAIEPAPRDGRLAPSFAQQRLWFLEQVESPGSAYHMAEALRLRGPLDRAALARALDRVVARHEALRTVFPMVDGGPVQHVVPAEASGFHVAELDLGAHADAEAELRRLAAEDADAPFDLERGPLFRARLVRLAANEHVLVLAMHHTVSDGWSMGVLTRELGALYAAFRRGDGDPLAPLPVQYADYAAWQRRWVEGDVLRRQADYWTRALGGAPELLELPVDRPRPARRDPAGATLALELDEALTARLEALSRRTGTTLFMTLLAGWAVVLARLSGQDDVVVGTPTAGRGRTELEGLIGFFVNTLALRVDVRGSASVADVLGRVKARALEAQANQDIPFEQVVERLQPARSLAYQPLFQVLFAWQNALGGGLELPGVEVSPVAAPERRTAMFDLSLEMRPVGGRIAGELEYATALFDRATVERVAGCLRRVLDAMAADEHRRVDGIALLSPAERARIVGEWNRTEAAAPVDLHLHARFEAHAARDPRAVAVVSGDVSLSYGELDERANRLAHHLQRLGVGPEARVGVCLPWHPDLLVALLATLKAGGVYVPLDPALPAERLAYMADDAGVAVLVTRGAFASPIAGATVRLDADAERIAAEPGDAPVSGVHPEGLAYLVYTSGSTGRPKGVAVPHGAGSAHFTAMGGRLGINPADRVLQFASPGFDASLEQVFLTLLAGATLVLRGPELWAPAGFGDRVRALGVTVADLPPAYWQEIVAAAPAGALAGLRLVLVGGDAVPVGSAPGGGSPRLLNCYGPTEAVVSATAYEVPAGFPGRYAGATVPIGRALPGHAAYVVDARGEPVPPGVEGELVLGGLLARGYLGRPGLTAERFVPDAFGGVGGRLYRTGDRARWSEDGELEFLGRTDFQVKIRGFRIELGEIEARLAEHPGVRGAVVIAREDAPGDRRLAAYYLGEALEVADLRAHLAERLPEHMVPAAYVRLDEIPLTPNNKVDRARLPAPGDDAFSARGYEAPAGETEEAVSRIWGELLRAGRVGRNDHFFALGGHSLLAVQAVSRVREALGVEAAPGDIFERPVLADFARGLEGAARAALSAIERVDRGGRLAPSFAQTRLWFLEQLGTAGAAYHVPVRLRLKGALDREALGRALDRIVARHEALRTVFAQVAGEPEQRVLPADESGFRLVDHDLRAHAAADAELRRLTAEETNALFDLARGPLVRGRLVRMAEDEHELLLTMHHIVSDAWSMEVLTRELGALYAAFLRGEPDPLPPLPVQYADYAAWQRRWAEGERLEAQAEYWKRALGGAPELLELPTDHPRPETQDHAGATVEIALDEALTAGLKALSRRHGTTLFMTLLAGWATVLARLSGQDEVVIGTPSANRGRTEIEGLIGFFINTLPLRVDLTGPASVPELLGRVKARALEAQQHQDIPFEQVVELLQPVRSLAYQPVFQVWFVWQNAASAPLELPGLEPAPVQGEAEGTAHFDLTLSLYDAGGRIAGDLTYATSLFERATAERFVGYLRAVLRGMADEESRRVDRLPLLPAAERARVVEGWNATAAAYPSASCLHHLFEAQAERTPGAPAVSFEGTSLTYAELNARANRLAAHLAGAGVGPDVRVGLSVERGLEMMVGLLAVLKAGGAYVPLDPSYPEERLRYMLADSAPAVLLTQASLAARFAGAGIPVLAIDRDEGAWAERPAANPAIGGLTPDHLAYVIYTSGSTGLPKGVMVAHRGVVNVLSWMQDAWRLGADDAVLQKTPYSFDASLRELLPPLFVGARLVMARPGGHKDAAYLLETIRAEGITTLHFVPSMLQVLADEADFAACTTVRRVACGGEAMPPALVERFHAMLPQAELYNVYGPTETAVDVTAWRCEPGQGGAASIPIGRPMANTRAYLLDRAGEPVAIGAVGELFLGGVQVARGYRNRPAMTAERFVPDPFGGGAGGRLYRTGDLGRWRADGAIDFLGRGDVQVKIRGNRVELGEIEARLREHAGVREAVVAAREDTPGERRLVAYCVGDAAGAADELRAHLSERLPEYMVPAAFVALEALPRMPNGKVDRRALLAPEVDTPPARAFEAPVGRVEEALAKIWSELLGVETIGRRDSFFELGGHSLRAIQLISRVRQVLGFKVKLGELFQQPVLADFARTLDPAAAAALPAIAPVDRGGRLAPSFAQARLWFLEQLGGVGPAYHVPVRLRMRGELDVDALRRALDRIVARHESLRTVFAQGAEGPEQRVLPVDASGFHLAEDDLAGDAAAEDALRRMMAEEADAPFDLARGPLVRGRLVRMAADDHALLLTLHHVVSDGWSLGILTRELGALYAAFRRGEADPLAPLPVQYADYAAWQRRWVDGDLLRQQADYWRKTLVGAPGVLALPTDRPRPARQDHAGALLEVALDEALTAELGALSRRHGTTLFMTLLAAWAVVLGRLSGQQDVVIGTPTANRGRTEIEGLIGFFVNTLALRVDLSGPATVAELLGRVKARALEAQQHQDIPFEQVVEGVQPARSLSHTPLFQVTFGWTSAAAEGLALPGLDVARVDTAEDDSTAKFDLALWLVEEGGRITGGVTYATALFDHATVERYAGYLRRVLEGMVADDRVPVERLDLLSAAERARVVEEWNATESADVDAVFVHHRFEAQAARTPDAVALSFDGRALSYAALNADANRLAHHLRTLGVGPDVRVGICVERGMEMVVALLAVLKAGGAYLPLDPEYPEDRLRYMVADAGPAVLLTQAASAARFAGTSVPVVEVDADAATWAGRSAENPADAGLTPAHLAYVIYTSGSTGRPKGVMVSHASLANHTAWQVETFGIGAADTVLQRTSISFDASVWELWTPLVCGARMLLLPRAATKDPAEIGRVMRRGGVTIAQFVPTLLQALLDELPEDARLPCRTLFCGGEPLPARLVAAARARGVGQVVNLYGPTEATIDSTSFVCPEPTGDGRAPSIGRPIRNMRSYVLDPAGEPVPVGVAGELHVGGAGVARGYLGRPGMTAERFVPDPFSTLPGTRLYRTGDLGRWLADGTIEYLGRNDQQVKVRGFRIEPGEIESRLAQHPAVREAVAVAREDAPGDRRLVAYWVGSEGTDAEALRTHLSERLPDHMLPAAFVRLDSLPLTPNGKTDRAALPAPDDDAFARRGYEAPEGETETALAEIWADVLRVERVGRHDHFFELGGHSLLATRLLPRIRQGMDVEIELSDVFESPVLSVLAERILDAQLAQFDPLAISGLTEQVRTSPVG